MDLPEKERQALLRFAQFESRKIEAADDTTLLIVLVALRQLRERNPKRMALIDYGVESLLRGSDG